MNETRRKHLQAKVVTNVEWATDAWKAGELTDVEYATYLTEAVNDVEKI
jgi:hypothetical protein